MKRKLEIEDMTPGQLKLEYASTCQWHQCDGGSALAWSGTMDAEVLRAALLDYRAAALKKDWSAAQEALLRVLPDALKAGAD
jgi:hypothetical protein